MFFAAKETVCCEGVPNAVPTPMNPTTGELAHLLQLAREYQLDPHDLDEEVANHSSDEWTTELVNQAGVKCQITYLLAVRSAAVVEKILQRHRRTIL